MAQLDAYRRYSEASQSAGTQSSPHSKTPKAQTSPTFQQLLQGEASLWSPNSSPKLRKKADHEEDHSPHNKKSVLAKVKERAKKLRHSFSGKKHHQDQHPYSGDTTPSWGVRLEDYEDEEEDPEYLGAPMYESELAPANYKETAKQHPREVHGVPSEKHVVASSVNKEVANEKVEHLSPNKTVTETVSQKLGPAYATVSETVSEKLGPAYAAVSDATQNVANRFARLTVSTPEGTEAGVGNTAGGINNRSSPQTWDKGVSVKEYLMQKFEPGEDERVLSQVISETISPRRGPGDPGMVEKMKGAVSSFLWAEESSQALARSTKSSMDNPNASVTNASSPILVSTTKADLSSRTSLSPTNATTTKTSSSSSRTSLSPTNASTTKSSSLSRTSHSATNASTNKADSSSCTSQSPFNASTPKTSSPSHTSLSATNTSTSKADSSSHTSLSPTNAHTTKTSLLSRTSHSATKSSTKKASDSSSRSSLSPTYASTTKEGSSSHTSLSPTTASTTKTSSLPHIHTDATTNTSRPTITRRSLSVHAPASTTIASATKTSSSDHAPISTTKAKSSAQIPVSTYVTEGIQEENHGRALQAN